MKTSDASMELAVLFCQNKFLDKSAEFRRKLDVDQVENVSLKAAVAVNIQDELLKLVPLDSVKLSEQWTLAWAKGDAKVDVELESMIMDKNDSLDVRQIPTLKRLLDEHVFSRPVANTQHQQESLTMDEFNLFVKQMEYDIQVFQTWEKKQLLHTLLGNMPFSNGNETAGSRVSLQLSCSCNHALDCWSGTRSQRRTLRRP